MILEKLDELLDDFVYKKLWSSLTTKEKEIIHSMYSDEEKVGDICSRLNITSGTLSKYKESLAKKGIIYTSKYGYIQIALPRFNVVAKTYLI